MRLTGNVACRRYPGIVGKPVLVDADTPVPDDAGAQGELIAGYGADPNDNR